MSDLGWVTKLSLRALARRVRASSSILARKPLTPPKNSRASKLTEDILTKGDSGYLLKSHGGEDTRSKDEWDGHGG